MVSATFYILYAGVTSTFNSILFVSIILLFVEILVLLLNKWTCPMVTLAEKYTSERSYNFDIYLPNWLAKNNKTIFGTIFVIGITLVIINWVKIL